MSTTTIAVVFLIVSYFGFFIQMLSLVRLVRSPPRNTPAASLTYKGLVRTSACRVAAAVIYVWIGTNVLFFSIDIAVATLASFCVVQVMWMISSRLDVHLKRRIEAETAKELELMNGILENREEKLCDSES